ncbi:MAG: bifunctional diguanylate cyclase/phosphodiesterase [Lachnospiraceae bacterium]|nr:bifunctional diguanylate cyclase/phosphodiesterase [Lachnospiraceae bacterium]
MQTVLEWLKKELGFIKVSPYEKRYINTANIHTAIYMSFIGIVMELWMIIRYVHQRPGKTFFEYFDGETNYLIFFSASLLLLVFSVRYIRELGKFNAGKIIAIVIILMDICLLSRYLYTHVGNTGFFGILFGLKYHLLLFAMAAVYFNYEFAEIFEENESDIYGQILIVLYSLISVGFGVDTSLYDISWGRQILCFLTMVMFAACLLVWRPYSSIIILGVSFIYFYSKWKPHLEELDLEAGKVLQGDTINYFILFVVLVMVSFSLYHQRKKEAEKDESLLETYNRLNRIAVEDDLTGIHNMVYFNQEAEYQLADESVDIEDWIYLFLNIENFKTYNDQIGYQAGNAYLKRLAELIRDTFSGDPVARLSDDHFVILTKADDMDDKIETIRKDVHREDDEVYMELKVGAYRPVARDQDPRIAIDYARYACGLTKNKYNVNFREYDKEVDSIFHKRQYIVNNIDNAILNGHIKAYYQPVVWSESREMCGCEALARWIDPTYGFLSPGEFIPVLEENRQIHKLDECILKQVCKQMHSAMSQNKPVAPVSINFSRIDFEMMDVVALLEEMTHKYNIPKEYIHVEITESTLTDSAGIIKKAMDQIHKAGYSIWLDDFGSGYSSLNVLKDYNFDVMKIDMKFLSNFGENKESSIILNTVINLAGELDMISLTEGVETDEIADFLTKNGCKKLQGYLFGKPMPEEEIREKIDSGFYKISEKHV